jgi:hypothetical protein
MFGLCSLGLGINATVASVDATGPSPSFLPFLPPFFFFPPPFFPFFFFFPPLLVVFTGGGRRLASLYNFGPLFELYSI